jgi:hypothetical protein
MARQIQCSFKALKLWIYIKSKAEIIFIDFAKQLRPLWKKIHPANMILLEWKLGHWEAFFWQNISIIYTNLFCIRVISKHVLPTMGYKF